MSEINLADTVVSIDYGENVNIVEGRFYVESFLMVSDEIWDDLDLQEEAAGVLAFTKKENPKRLLQYFQANWAQLTKIDVVG